MAVAEWQKNLANRLGLSGKIRVAGEGVNVTVAGELKDIETYMSEMSDWDGLAGLGLANGSEESTGRRKKFFKPSFGCVHAFPSLSVKVVPEICPFGVKDWQPKSLPSSTSIPSEESAITALTPASFHTLISNRSSTHLLLDIRNHYETALGHFTNAHLPPIRRFSSLPNYIESHPALLEDKEAVVMYCTGGVRCEKAAAWVVEKFGRKVFTLDGGIHAYL
ncbi:thiosulfate sulfurtransferase (rhodanese)-like domain-containing protein 2, partial [Borealophlyctis nickersoniae]